MLLSTVLETIDLSALELSAGEICLRLLCALAVGAVVGMERERHAHPAGMRTHMLVALGACAVMITGQLIYAQYRPYGSSPDPARLPAQVVTGVGFLGAGTILREGTTVHGLTTAASLWAVACLGVAAGGGYYLVALLGMGFIILTLTAMEVIANRLRRDHAAADDYTVVCVNLSAGMQAVQDEAAAVDGKLSRLEAEHDTAGGVYRISFHMEYAGNASKRKKEQFFENLSSRAGIASVSCMGGPG